MADGIVRLRQSTAFNAVVLIVLASDRDTGATGQAGSMVIQASKDGGSLSTITPTVTEIGSGLYKLALTTSHTDTLGMLVLNITCSLGAPKAIFAQVETATFQSADFSSEFYDEITANITGSASYLEAVSDKLATDAEFLTGVSAAVGAALAVDATYLEALTDKFASDAEFAATIASSASLGVFATTVDGADSFANLIRGMHDAMVGRTSGYGTSTILIKSRDGTKTRYTVTVASTGRTAITTGDLT